MPSSRASSVLAHAAGLVVILWVLYPVFFHAWVHVPAPSIEVVTAVRAQPDAPRLRRLADQRPLGPTVPEAELAVAIADRWLGALRRGDAEHPLRSPLRAEDFARDNDMGVLPFASLYAADVLVAAHAASGRVEHLDAARRVILAFARFERSAWRDQGLLWNDHAIAARVGVVLRFWSAWRGHPSFEPGSAAEILQHVARSAALLARPSHFTAWSNHGVMQNIALLQVAAAFPDLVDAPAMRRIALERLEMQWGYYISAEGVILEHSAGYHAEGLSLLTLAMDLLRLNDLTLPQGWTGQLDRGRAFLADITRPDGTLPAYGDTYVGTNMPGESRPAATAASIETRVWPASGYALVRARAASAAVAGHAMLTWSYFRGQAHKHADEPGLVLWAAGRGWITPSGYAPYGSEQRLAVEGWLGSNAPHAEGEVPDPHRSARLNGYAAGRQWAVLDAERSNSGGAASFRRQFVQVAGCRWIVIDHAARAEQATETIWTFMPDLALSRLSADTFQINAGDGAGMHVQLFGSEAPRTTLHRGSRDPMVGWTAGAQGIGPSPALRVLSAASGWSAAVFSLAGCEGTLSLRIDAPDRWEVLGASWRLVRQGAQLNFTDDGVSVDQVALATVPETSSVADARRALASALAAYPKYRNVDHYRLRMAAWLGALWLALVAASVGLWRWGNMSRAAGSVWGAALLLGWVGVALWLQWWYFVI